jgi:hypothetical protein
MLPSDQAIAISGTRANAATVSLLMFSALPDACTCTDELPPGPAAFAHFRVRFGRSGHQQEIAAQQQFQVTAQG